MWTSLMRWSQISQLDHASERLMSTLQKSKPPAANVDDDPGIGRSRLGAVASVGDRALAAPRICSLSGWCHGSTHRVAKSGWCTRWAMAISGSCCRESSCVLVHQAKHNDPLRAWAKKLLETKHSSWSLSLAPKAGAHGLCADEPEHTL